MDPHIEAIFSEMVLLFGIGLVILMIGFYRALYFISTGYALVIATMAVVSPLRHLANLTAVSVLQNLFLLLWGLRLAVFLIRREFQTSYQTRNRESHEAFARIPAPAKILIWVAVAGLYVLMFSPSLFHLVESPAPDTKVWNWVQVAGLGIMGVGMVLETLADQQKSCYKTDNPNVFCGVGLYRWVRTPNYLGEILFWVGNWVASLTVYKSPFKWIAATLGLVFIVGIMIDSARRLEIEQRERYGQLPEYQEYVRSVPILFPFIPWYSFKRVQPSSG